MIKNREDYLYYLEADRIALKVKATAFSMLTDDIWSFQRTLRRYEYRTNSGKPHHKLLKFLTALRFRRLSRRLSFSIPRNSFGPGLSIAHHGTIVVNSKVRIGANCRLHVCVNVGASGGSKEAPKMGDYIYIAPGAKIFGQVCLGNRIIIGANAVVNKSVEGDDMAIAGMPAKKISDRFVEDMVVDATGILDERIKQDPNYLKKATRKYRWL